MDEERRLFYVSLIWEKSEYRLGFAITEDATDVPFLETDSRYRLENVKIDEYNDQPQFQIDESTSVSRLESSPSLR